MLAFDAGRLATAMQFLVQASDSLARPEIANCEISALPGELREFYLDGAKRLIKYCDDMGLATTSAPATRIFELIEDGGTFTAGMMADMLADVSRRLRDRLGEQVFLKLLPDRAKYYGLQNGFGIAVQESFPSAAFDVGEACQCYALRRNTACVFHLMRALEVCLAIFADQFSVPHDRANWQSVIDGIEKAVRNMGADPARSADWKDQQEFFSQAASHLLTIKNAWRNYTAHARGKYSDEEAEALLISVRAMMQTLATRLRE